MSLKEILILLILLFLVTSLPEDPSTFSNHEQIIQTKLEVNFNINFEENIIYSTAKYYFKALMDGEVITLDTNHLEIDSIIDSNTGEPVDYILDNLNGLIMLGVPLKIYYSYSKDEEIILLIKAKTTPQSQSALFLTPEMTYGKKYPYMFTQGETILVRELIPIQDTPMVKFPVYASITVPKPLRGVYSGIFKSQIEKENIITYFYEQNVPVPSYLIAFAAGDIEERTISNRCRVYSEREKIEEAAKEFSDIEKFMQVMETYLFDYEWGQYNMLVLPPSFPFGGMENPCLTFVTPALIAGDKSQVSTLAHELCHSWSGNLVTNKKWNNFFMNEGFTVFLERKINLLLNGEDSMKISALSGYESLEKNVNNLGETNEFTKLIPNFVGVNPDDSINNIPYEKGFNMLYYLENLVNSNSDRDIFKMILKDYFKKYSFKSVEFSDFNNIFTEKLKLYLPDKAEEILGQIDWNNWLYDCGMPNVKNNFTNNFSNDADENLYLFKNNLTRYDIFMQKFLSWENEVRQYFLKGVISMGKLNDYQYNILNAMRLYQNFNAGIKNSFYQIMLNTGKLDHLEELDGFLGEFGVSAFLRPLYQGLAQIDKGLALSIFEKHKKTYHPIIVRAIENIIKHV